MESKGLGGANYLAELKKFLIATNLDSYVAILLDAWKKTRKNKIFIQAKERDWEIDAIQKTFEDMLKKGSTGQETSIQLDLMKIGERPYELDQQIPGVPKG